MSGRFYVYAFAMAVVLVIDVPVVVAEDTNRVGVTPDAVGEHDYPMWGLTSARVNAPEGQGIPLDWDCGDEGWIEEALRYEGLRPKESRNVRWAVCLGSQTYGNPIVANGKVFVGTNNGAGYLKRYPPHVDLGVLLCFDEQNGNFLWQHSNTKLRTGRVHDWPLQGVCSTPIVQGDRLWYVSNRGEVICLDTEGFYDGEDDGPDRSQQNQILSAKMLLTPADKHEADVVWSVDMIGELGVSPHNMSNCSPLIVGNRLFVCTSNGLDESHVNIPKPDAPSFLAMDKDTGEVLWSFTVPGKNILHAQWASPSYGVLYGQPQVIFPGGDGWVYSFDPAGDGSGGPKLLWKFDGNLKTSEWILGGRGTRNNIIAFPAIYDDLVYVTMGQDPEHGDGEGRLWCIDPRRMDGADVSAELAVDLKRNIIPHRRLQAVDPARGERAIANPDSAVVWSYSKFDQNMDDQIDFEEEFHRSLGIPAIRDDVLYVGDFSGIFHCVDAKTGKVHWTYDMLAACWGSALVVDGKVYIGDEDGIVSVFRHSPDPKISMTDRKKPISVIEMPSSIYMTPIVANNVLYVATKNTLFAIAADEHE